MKYRNAYENHVFVKFVSMNRNQMLVLQWFEKFIQNLDYKP